jgi:hypothetical protein
LPPLLAISRCFAGSIAAKPRFDLPLVFVAISITPNAIRQQGNAAGQQRFTMLIEVRKWLFSATECRLPDHQILFRMRNPSGFRGLSSAAGSLKKGSSSCVEQGMECGE